ncbi:MAG: peptidoglycan bridge formation glycyltransferase FemA/FemB family protein, partial [Patescibacteria group bacterium]
MLEIRIITNKDSWETFVLSQPFTLFVQSWNYGEFYRQLGEDFFVLGIYDSERLIGGSLVVTTHAKRGNFLYLPYGPMLPDKYEQEALDILLSWLASYAKEHHYHFLRISPFLDETLSAKKLYRTAGCRNAPMHILAETTWIADIAQSESELLSAMNKNHRNLIRRCEREGVRVTMDGGDEALDDLNRMLDETVKKHGFVRFSRLYIEREFHAFASEQQTAVFRSYLPDGTLDAAAIFMFYGTMTAYRHSASYGKDKRLPTSYLL